MLCYLIFMHYATLFNCMCTLFPASSPTPKPIAPLWELAGVRLLFCMPFYLFFFPTPCVSPSLIYNPAVQTLHKIHRLFMSSGAFPYWLINYFYSILWEIYYKSVSTDERTETRKEYGQFWATMQISGRPRAPGSKLVFHSSQKEKTSHIHSFQYMNWQSWKLFQKAGPKYCSGGTQLMKNTEVTCKIINLQNFWHRNKCKLSRV